MTLLDFAGCSAPDYMQGSSSVYFKVGQNRWLEEPLTINTGCIWRITMPGHIAMRTKRYKLIQFYGTAEAGYRSDRSRVHLQVGSCMT